MGGGPGRPWSPAAGDALPSTVSQQTPFFLGVVRGAGAPASERRLLRHRWNKAAQNRLPTFPQIWGCELSWPGPGPGHPSRAPQEEAGAVALGGAGGLFWEPGIWKPSGQGGGVAGEGRGGEPPSSRPHTGPPLGSSGVGPTAPLLALSPANASQPAASSPSTGCLSCEMRSHTMQ